MSLLLNTCYCNHVHICVCKTPKFELLTDTSVSLPISNPPGSSSVVSEPPVPVLGMTPSSGHPVPVLDTRPSSGHPVPILDTRPSSDIQFLYWVRRGSPVPLLVKTPSSNNPTGPEPGTSLLFMSMLLPLHTCHCNHVYICVKKFLTDIPVSLPISSPPGSGSVISGPVPVLGMTLTPVQFLYWVQHPQVDLQFLYMLQRLQVVTLLVQCLVLLVLRLFLPFMSKLLPLHTCHCNNICSCACKTPKFKFLTDISVFA